MILLQFISLFISSHIFAQTNINKHTLAPHTFFSKNQSNNSIHQAVYNLLTYIEKEQTGTQTEHTSQITSGHSYNFTPFSRRGSYELNKVSLSSISEKAIKENFESSPSSTQSTNDLSLSNSSSNQTTFKQKQQQQLRLCQQQEDLFRQLPRILNGQQRRFSLHDQPENTLSTQQYPFGQQRLSYENGLGNPMRRASCGPIPQDGFKRTSCGPIPQDSSNEHSAKRTSQDGLRRASCGPIPQDSSNGHRARRTSQDGLRRASCGPIPQDGFKRTPCGPTPQDSSNGHSAKRTSQDGLRRASCGPIPQDGFKRTSCGPIPQDRFIDTLNQRGYRIKTNSHENEQPQQQKDTLKQSPLPHPTCPSLLQDYQLQIIESDTENSFSSTSLDGTVTTLPNNTTKPFSSPKEPYSDYESSATDTIHTEHEFDQTPTPPLKKRPDSGYESSPTDSDKNSIPNQNNNSSESDLSYFTDEEVTSSNQISPKIKKSLKKKVPVFIKKRIKIETRHQYHA